jgi:hypothetical protein
MANSNYSENNYYINDTTIYSGSTPAVAQHPNYLEGWHYSGNIATQKLVVQLYDGTNDSFKISNLRALGILVRVNDNTIAKNPIIIVDTKPQVDGNDFDPAYRSRHTYTFPQQLYPNENVVCYVENYREDVFGNKRKFHASKATVGPHEYDEDIKEIRIETDSAEASCDLILIKGYVESQHLTSSVSNFSRVTNYYPYQNNNQLMHGANSNDQVYPVSVDTDGHLQVDVLSAPHSHVDDSAFTVATDEVGAIGAMFDDIAPDSIDEGDIGILRQSANRNLYINLRDGSGNERGANVNASNQLEVEETNSASILSDTSNILTVNTNILTDTNNITTSVQLLDDTVATLGTDTYTEATSKGLLIGAVRNDTLATLADTDNEIAPLQVNADGALYVDISSASVTVDSEFPAAGTITDAFANPSTTSVMSMGMGWNGATWDRLHATAGDLHIHDGGNSITVDNAGTFAVQASQSGTWNINDISGTVSLPTGASTSALQTSGNSSLTDIETNTDSLAVVGGGVEATALRVTLASDSTGVLSVDDNGGSLTVDASALDIRALTNSDVVSNEMTVVPVGGSQANMWNAATPGAGGKSTAFDCQYSSHVDIFGTVNGACELTVELSQDNTNFYSSIYAYTASGSEDFHIPLDIGCRYIRLDMDSGGVQVTATGASKH